MIKPLVKETSSFSTLNNISAFASKAGSDLMKVQDRTL